ncbi:MAG: prepilin-type N-terminal cleavage/methylation domain-containing protein [Campylobacterota bacterium]|nr:prepilin-type N-terminal cleavage/methylation domain-containing protein [Campylobacterota bacterium]
MVLKIKTLSKKAFTLLEMIIVMVVLGIMASFGVEVLVNSYENYIFTSVNNRLQSHSESAVEQIANRLQYRIKDSVIKRDSSGFYPIASSNSANIIEWVGVDREGWLGNTLPLWSGFIDLDAREDAANLYTTDASNTLLISPNSNTAALSTQIQNISPTTTDLSNAALYFIGSSTHVNNSYGWGGAANDMHAISSATANEFTGNFNNVKIYEYYQLSWSAYAIVHDTAAKTLTLHYDYQPWEGDSYANATSALLMNNVTAFNFRSVGDILKVQVCVSEDDLTAEGEYAICKEKTIF